MKTLMRNPTRNQGLQTSWYRPLDKFFRNDFLNLWDGDLDTIPSVNISEDKNSYKIEMAAPGLKKEDFNISLDRNILTISSEKETEKTNGEEKDNYYRREYNYTSFSRSMSLPENVDTTKIDAKYMDGILNLTIPKNEDSKKNNSRRIEVK